MLANYVKIIVIILGLIGLASCQITSRTIDKPQVDDLSLSDVNRQNEYIDAAIHLLETGDSGTAEKMIRDVLNYNKNHPTANLLLIQLTLSSEQIFNTSRLTTYQVKAGDSLGLIAKKWLGNELYFISLARLNKISKPASLQPGVKIKIPVTEQSSLVQKEQIRSSANLKLLSQYREQKQFIKGLNKTNQLFIVEKDLPRLLNEQQQLLDAWAESSVSFSDRAKMLEMTRQISANSRNNQQLQVYQSFINNHNRQLLLDEALLLFDDQSYIEAAGRLIDAKQIETKIEDGTDIFRMQKLLLNKLHEQAVLLYRNHSLQEALIRWSLILKLEPENELAQRYSERTHKLIKKLNQY